MRLLEPLKVRGIELPNRIVYPPCDTSYPTWQGEVTDLMVESYRYKARNCGLCIVEASCIEPTGKAIPREGLVSDDSCIPGIARLADAIHKEGAIAGLQIHHAGMCSFFSGDAKVWGPSKVLYPSFIPSVDMVEACSKERIEELVQRYVDAAVRVKKAGFDLVEIHGAHGYLITQFLNARINQRTDEYGGSLENRMRFPLEIARRVREAIGSDTLLCYRYNGQDWPDSPMDPVGSDGNGWTVEDAKVFGKRLEAEGVDLLHISAGNYDCIQWEVQPAEFPQGCLIDLAAEVKKVVNIPVIGVGRIWDPRYAEQILQEDKVDLVGIARQLIADYQYLAKVKAGRFDDINRCIYCLYGCMNRDVFNGHEMTCTANYLVGREDKLREEDLTAPAAAVRKVLVIGGGVAGMAAANTAAQRGHDVVLVEREAELGGQARIAGVAAGREPIGYQRVDLERALATSKARVLKNTAVTLDLLKQEKPDVVVVAVGARPRVPLRFQSLVSEGKVVTFDDVLSGKVAVGNRVVIYGGGEAAARTADHLAFDLGKKVKVITRSEALAADFVFHDRNPLMARLASKDVEIITGIQDAKTITASAITYLDGNGVERSVEGDTIVIALQMEPSPSRDEVLKMLSQPSAPLTERYVIGDALTPGTLWSAYQDGVSLGLRI